MCGRFTRTYTWREIHEFLDLAWPSAEEMKPSYNVAPTQRTPVCATDGRGGRVLRAMTWGFRPSWAGEGGPAPINARGETVATSPMFRGAFARRRCVVPTSGFYEWKSLGGRKQPYYIRPAEGGILCMGGVWESAGAEDATFAIITTAPNELMAEIHDRMPMIVPRDRLGEWMSGEDVRGMMGPCPSGWLRAHAVGTRVNRPANDDPSLIDPMGSGSLFG